MTLGASIRASYSKNIWRARGYFIHSVEKGTPYDNACIESFHSVLKKEEIYLHTYGDSKEARRAIFEYIEGWYNRKRIHSSIIRIVPSYVNPDCFNTCFEAVFCMGISFFSAKFSSSFIYCACLPKSALSEISPKVVSIFSFSFEVIFSKTSYCFIRSRYSVSSIFCFYSDMLFYPISSNLSVYH